MKKGDIAINTIFVILITIISIMLVIGLFSLKLPGFAKGLYCNTFFFIHRASFLPESIRADQDYCSEKRPLSTEIINDPDEVIKAILGYSIACWDRANEGTYDKSIICYELTMGPVITSDITITENDFVALMKSNNVCDYLGDNGFDSTCGSADNLNWNLADDTAYPGQNILIEYSSQTPREIIIS